MMKLASVLYGINGVTCLFIGSLHTMAHYQDLVTSEIKDLLSHKIMVTGIESDIWNLWQGMSLMMGFLLIIIGLLHLSILKNLKKDAFPPIAASCIMILMLLGVIYAGALFFGSWQVYGGIIGILLQSVCLFLALKNKPSIV